MKRTVWLVLCCVTGIAALYRLFVTTLPGQEVDQAVMTALQDVPSKAVTAAGWVGAAIVPLWGISIVTIAVLGLVRHRYRRYGSALLGIGGASLSTEVLKRLLPRPAIDEHPMTNSFPSGHVTAVTALVVALLVLAPVAARPVIARLGAIAVATTALSVVILQWHRPSDTAAAVLVAIGWGAIGVALGRGGARVVRRPAPVLAARVVALR